MNPDADKQEIRNYLLGTLDSDRRTQWEERILSAPETYEELLMAEEELIDQYVAGGLTKLEQQQFETNFLTTAERQTNLRFGQLLNRYVNSHQVQIAQKDPVAAAAIPHVQNAAPAQKSFRFSLFSLASLRAMAVSVIGVALLGLLVLCWLALRPRVRSVEHSDEPTVTVTLLRRSTKDEGTTPQRVVNVPPKGYKLKLELELANARFRNYKSELFRENKSVQTSESEIESKGQQYVVPLTITGEMLSPGDYQVKLSGVLDSGLDEFIEKYSFRVIE